MKSWTIASLALAALAVTDCGSLAAETCKPGCQEIFNPVCGSDGKTYGNQCSFDLEKCTTQNDKLTVVAKGACSSSSGNGSAGSTCTTSCTKIYKPVCGSDGKTYSNACTLKNASCKDKMITLAAEGECGSSAGSGSTECEKSMCMTIYDPVCGSDGQTYSNECVFGNAQCDNEALTLSGKGDCPAGESDTKSVSNDTSSSGSVADCEVTACTKEAKPVCGSDGVTYSNECLLKNAQCESASLVKLSDGECTSAPSPDPTSMAPAVAFPIAASVTTIVAAYLLL